MAITYEEYKLKYKKLTSKQKMWLKEKSKIENMTQWAIMNDWEIPANDVLNSDGTHISYDEQEKLEKDKI